MWEQVTAEFMKDKMVEQEFGWVREMFAWSLAALKVGLTFQYNGMENGILDRKSGVSIHCPSFQKSLHICQRRLENQLSVPVLA